jgi:hypothetical protein
MKMALKLYKDLACTQLISSGSPLTTQHPIAGSAVTVNAYIKNDDATKYYTTVAIDPQDTTGSDESSYVQLSSDGVTYQATSAALSLSDFGSAGTPDTAVRTIYVKVTTPSVADTQNKTDIFLNVTGREFAV